MEESVGIMNYVKWVGCAVTVIIICRCKLLLLFVILQERAVGVFRAGTTGHRFRYWLKLANESCQPMETKKWEIKIP